MFLYWMGQISFLSLPFAIQSCIDFWNKILDYFVEGFRSLLSFVVNLISYTNMTDIQGILLILDITSWQTSLPYPSKPWKVLHYFTEYWYYSGQQIWKKNTCHFSISPQEISTGKRNMNRVKYRTVGHFIGLAIGQWTNRMTLNTI